MGSVNWASGLITLGCLYLRPLQQHFHSLGLTNRFTQPCQSDPLVLATLLRQWQELSFLMSGIPIQPFQAEFTILTDVSTQGWGARMGDSQIVAYINKQGGTHSQAGSRSVSLAADSKHSSSSQTHSGLPQCDSRLVISAEPAHHYRVESPPRGRESDIQTVGNSSTVVDMFATVHNTHLPQFMSPVPEP